MEVLRKVKTKMDTYTKNQKGTMKICRLHNGKSGFGYFDTQSTLKIRETQGNSNLPNELR